MAILGPIETRSYAQAVNQPTVQVMTLLQRVRALQEVMNEQTQHTVEHQRQTQLLSDRANRAEATLSVSILRVQEMERKSRELVIENSKLNPPEITESPSINDTKKEPETIFEWAGEKICDLGACIFAGLKAFIRWITCRTKNQ
jgi:hypothetical protein